MTPRRFKTLTGKYAGQTVAVVGDFSLDRYLEIDPALNGTSIETGRTVHNVTRVRSQPGSAGTIVNNLAALGVGRILPVGFCGEDGEGYELLKALKARPGVLLDHFVRTRQRRTFTYCKPLVLEPGSPPRELDRLDSKNWDTTPAAVQDKLIAALNAVADAADAIIVMDQVDVPETGVVTTALLEAVHTLSVRRRRLPILADSRRGLRGYPRVIFKMNGTELLTLSGDKGAPTPPRARKIAAGIAAENGRPVFVSLAEHGIVGALPDGTTAHVPIHPVRGEIDIVGAGDAVTANLTAALSAGARLEECLVLANGAASIVIHQLGTTGTADLSQLNALLFGG